MLHQKIEADQTSAFLAELTELSAKYGLAIGGQPVLFIVEPEDRAFSYRIDNDSKLSLG